MGGKRIAKYCGHCKAELDKHNQPGILYYRVDGVIISRAACYECADEEHKEKKMKKFDVDGKVFNTKGWGHNDPNWKAVDTDITLDNCRVCGNDFGTDGAVIHKWEDSLPYLICIECDKLVQSRNFIQLLRKRRLKDK